ARDLRGAGHRGAGAQPVGRREHRAGSERGGAVTSRSHRGALLGLALLAVAGLLAWLLRGERGAEVPSRRDGGAAAVAPAELPAFAAPDAEADAAVAPLTADDGSATVAGRAPTTGVLSVRVIWASDRTPAAGVGIFAVFWGGPDPRFDTHDG